MPAGMRLQWAQFGLFDSFDVLRSTSPMDDLASLPTPIATGLTTPYYVDSGVTPDTVYYYRVRAWRGGYAQVSEQIQAVASEDAYAAYVTSLLHFDGDLSDRADDARVWTNPDNLGFAAGRFGQALAKTASQRGIYTPASDAFDFGTGDFTLECWLYAGGMSRDFGAIIGSGTLYWGAPSTFLMLTGNALASNVRNRLHFGGNLLGTPLLMSGLLNAGQWYHVAISRAAGVCRMFVDGVLSQAASYTGSISFANNGTWIGSNGWDGAKSYLDGRIDELRVTKGVARYTADFALPTTAFPNPA